MTNQQFGNGTKEQVRSAAGPVAVYVDSDPGGAVVRRERRLAPIERLYRDEKVGVTQFRAGERFGALYATARIDMVRCSATEWRPCGTPEWEPAERLVAARRGLAEVYAWLGGQAVPAARVLTAVCGVEASIDATRRAERIRYGKALWLLQGALDVLAGHWSC